MDTTQVLLTVVLTITTIILVIVGIQLIFVLKELRKTLRTVNAIIDGLEKVGLSVEHGFTEVVGFFTGIKSILKIIDILHAKKDGKTK
jgi:hypothetical protein